MSLEKQHLIFTLIKYMWKCCWLRGLWHVFREQICNEHNLISFFAQTCKRKKNCIVHILLSNQLVLFWIVCTLQLGKALKCWTPNCTCTATGTCSPSISHWCDTGGLHSKGTVESDRSVCTIQAAHSQASLGTPEPQTAGQVQTSLKESLGS